MNKGFLDDTFEKALEAGQSMAKSGAKQIKQTFNPLQILDGASETGRGESGEDNQKSLKELKKGGNSTPLDFDNLQKSYGKEDEQKAQALANRLFQLVKSGEEKAVRESQEKDVQKQRQEAQSKEQKKQQEAQARQQQNQEMPQGKERKSILGGKKKKSVPPPATAELKPSQGKQ